MLRIIISQILRIITSGTRKETRTRSSFTVTAVKYILNFRN
jgi:hypothetical protein